MPVFFLLYAIGFLITTFGTYYLSLKTETTFQNFFTNTTQ